MDLLAVLGLLGSRTVTKQKWAGYLPCQHCRQHSPHVLMEQTEWSTLLWIRVIPARRNRALTCNYCRCVTQLKKEEALQLMRVAPAQAR
jgi:hypothetical protein